MEELEKHVKEMKKNDGPMFCKHGSVVWHALEDERRKEQSRNLCEKGRMQDLRTRNVTINREKEEYKKLEFEKFQQNLIGDL